MVEEGKSNLKVCAILVKGILIRPVIVQLSSQENTATGTYIKCKFVINTYFQKL